MFYFLIFFWLFRQTKAILFWLYLWQLKEYHIGRFIDHFRTEKGKQLLLNKLLIFKIVLLLGYSLILPWLNYQVWSIFLLILYFLETVKSFFDYFQKKLKTPIFTKKIIFLTFIIFFFELFYLISIFQDKNTPFYLLIFDIFTPVVASGIILVFQPLAALGRNQIIKKAKEKRAKFKNLIVIGITGSYGKTSTKEFLATILSEKFKVLKTKEHQNSEVGVSQCILNDLKEEHEIFVVEMGAYNRGGIKLLCDIAKPQIGILTGINEQHMATFGSQDNIVKTKYELIESLPEMGFSVFNGDNKYCRELYKRAHVSKRICYTTFSALAYEVIQGDFWTSDIKLEKESLYFKVFSRWGEIAEFKLNLLGEHYAQNILMAAIVAKEVLGMTLEEIAKVSQKIKPEQGGMRLIKTKDGLNIIDATYSANPDGVISHLEYLKILPGKKVIVLPCLIELGPVSREVHKRIGQKIGEVCYLAIITTRERFQDIIEGAMEKGMPSGNILFIENPKEIFEKIKTFCQPEDIILLESRVPTQLIDLLMQ